jgi:hypothetical protein
MGVNNKEGMMKTSWGKPVQVIPFCRTLLIVLAAYASSRDGCAIDLMSPPWAIGHEQ